MTEPEPADAELVAALAAFGGLPLGRADAEALAPWLRDVRAGLEQLRDVPMGDVLQVEPLLGRPAWPSR